MSTTQQTFADAPDTPEPNDAHFDGAGYETIADHRAFAGQLARVYALMSDGRWRTVAEIAGRTGDREPSILAQLGHLRKERFGAYPVERRRRGPQYDGDTSRRPFEYRVGEKGAGTPRHARCIECEEKDREIARLRETIRIEREYQGITLTD